MGNSAQPDNAQAENERYNPWTVVNLVFHHLVDEGLHPIFGDSGNPGAPAAELLIAMGIEPAAEGSQKAIKEVRAHLDELRAAAFGETEARQESNPNQESDPNHNGHRR
jgi:hypothetical protein